ncbi:PepSY domain-containing protein [Streptomyces sp. NRRL S-1813]|uniref:PepSY domain-containing protein n=1 Tax=Streptomyces sp. NRRL S-1813 TaxID=1463888 RepID=UPI00068E012A|nr:PepSY domain-containing protein [Streptomyces sp. NRRL S-1813]
MAQQLQQPPEPVPKSLHQKPATSTKSDCITVVCIWPARRSHSRILATGWPPALISGGPQGCDAKSVPATGTASALNCDDRPGEVQLDATGPHIAHDDGPAPQSSVQLSQNERHLDDNAKDRAQVKADKISQSEATAKALKAVPGTATSAELDNADRNGSLIWEVGVLGKDHKNHGVTLDAASGKVLDQHVDQDDNDDHDGDND